LIELSLQQLEQAKKLESPAERVRVLEEGRAVNIMDIMGDSPNQSRREHSTKQSFEVSPDGPQ
jgi:hypothetical protein